MFVFFYNKRYRCTASKNHSFIIMFLSFFLYEINAPLKERPTSSPKNFINAPGVYSKHYGKTFLCGLEQNSESSLLRLLTGGTGNSQCFLQYIED